MTFICNANTEIKDSQAATTYPDHIVNGDFEYYTEELHKITDFGYILVSPLQGYYYSNRWTIDAANQDAAFQPLPNGWNKEEFGWVSTQQMPVSTQSRRNNAVEIQRNYDVMPLNHHAELVEAQAGTAIYQDIATTPGSIYKWQLKHCSQQPTHVDTMSVMIGTPTSQTAQNATRISSNGTGKLGAVGTVISTVSKSTANRHANDWETYEGVYIVPTGQNVTRFTFKSIEGINSGSGNELDDISFSIADPLQYDLTGGTGNLPVPQASGNYPGYYQRSTSVTLSTIVPTRAGYTFLGWSDTKTTDISTAAQYQANSSKLIKNHTMYAGTNTVYAVWGKNPTVTFIDGLTNATISSVSVPFGSSLPSANVPQTPVHEYYDFTGYDKDLPLTTKIYENMSITLNYARNDLISVPAYIEWRDNNNYAGLRPPSVTLTLFADGIEVATRQVDASMGWRCDFEGLQAHDDSDGHLITYRVERQMTSGIPDDYDATDTKLPAEGGLSAGLAVEAIYIATMDIPVTKIWNDMNDVYRERPDSIEVILKCNDIEYETLSLSPQSDEDEVDVLSMVPDDEEGRESSNMANQWESSFENIPLWDENEEMFEWIVEEVPVYGYDSELVCVGETLNGGVEITNTIWKHIEMPETGESEIIWIWMLSAFLLLSAAIWGIVTVKKRRQ